MTEHRVELCWLKDRTWIAACSCGWQGRDRKHYIAAHGDLVDHREVVRSLEVETAMSYFGPES